jgi:aromatic-L-amino-acid/L-tryptophan decarboxylase
VAADPEAAEEEAVTGADLRRDGAAALDWAARYLERVGELPVLAQVEPGEVRARLPPSPPEHAEPFSDVLRDLDEVLLRGVTHWQHPRFFAYFATTGSEAGILAELLVATLNNVGFLWRTSPALTELELLTMDWLAQLLGLPAGWHGHIEDTASTSTLAALIAARHVTGRDVVVCSEHAHSSVDKAARMLGMELRKAPVDEELRMNVDGVRLDDAAVVVATVGTTSFAAVDPVPALAAAARAAGAWFHVDAAYAGSAWVCPELRDSQAGVELADSLVVNPHKWLLTPMDCSALWTSRPDDFRDAFSLVPEYLRTPEEVTSLSEYGPALGRRFRALKLWAVLRCHGREGLQRTIREHVRLAELFESWVREESAWEIVAPRRFSLVCFRHDGPDAANEALLERVNATGEIFISHTKLHQRYVLRLAIGNGRTSENDVRRAWDVLRREARAETVAMDSGQPSHWPFG